MSKYYCLLIINGEWGILFSAEATPRNSVYTQNSWRLREPSPHLTRSPAVDRTAASCRPRLGCRSPLLQRLPPFATARSQLLRMRRVALVGSCESIASVAIGSDWRESRRAPEFFGVAKLSARCLELWISPLIADDQCKFTAESFTKLKINKTMSDNASY